MSSYKNKQVKASESPFKSSSNRRQYVQIFTTDLPFNVDKIFYKGLITENKTISRDLVGDVKARFKNIVGGEIKAWSKLLSQGRYNILNEMVYQAQEVGANAIIGLKIETTSLDFAVVDIMIYGTAIYYE